MKQNPVKGDWFKLITKDFAPINEEINEEEIENQSEREDKKGIKEKLESMH